MNTNYMTFEKTLSGLSQGLQIRHIATYDLQTCAPDEEAATVLGQYSGFDQIPVRENGFVIGVLERNGSMTGTVCQRMHRLHEGILVSADQPLLDFVTLMTQPPFYRLVLTGTRVDGIVTRSDLLKLPVRLLGFAMITNLELLMKEIIMMQLPDDADWLVLLSSGRREKVKQKQIDYQAMRMDPPLLELTDFCDKKTILKKTLKLTKVFESDLAVVEKLRNLIAHAGNYASDKEELLSFISNLQKTRMWIETLSQHLG